MIAKETPRRAPPRGGGNLHREASPPLPGLLVLLPLLLLGSGGGESLAGDWSVEASGFAALRAAAAQGVDALQTTVGYVGPLQDGNRESLFLDPSFRLGYAPGGEDRAFARVELFSGEIYRQGGNPDPNQNRSVFDPDPLFPAGESDFRASWEGSHFVRQAYAEVSPWGDGSLEVSAGKRLRISGEGLVLEDYLTGGSLALHADAEGAFPLDFSAWWAKLDPGVFVDPSRRSSFAQVELSHPESRFEDLHLFYALLLDQDGNLAGVLNPLLSGTYVQSPLPPVANPLRSSRGQVSYLGIGGSRLLGDFFVDVEAVGEWGSSDLDWQPVVSERFPVPPRITTQGGALDASADWWIVPWLHPGLFFVYMTGEAGSASDILGNRRLSMFLGALPYLTRTNLFFRGGLNQSFGAGTLSLAGIRGRGVAAPGLTLTAPIGERIEVSAAAAELRASAPGAGEASIYGVETDLQAEMRLSEGWKLVAEADRMALGNFPIPTPVGFDGRPIPVESPVYRLSAGVDLEW